MTTPELLNAALKELKHYNYDKIKDSKGIDANISMSAESLFKELDIPRLDRFLILDHLVIDGYARVAKKSDGTLRAGLYWITYKGKLFLERGGYKRKAKGDQISNILGKLQYWALVVAAISASLYYLYEIVKIIYSLFFALQPSSG